MDATSKGYVSGRSVAERCGHRYSDAELREIVTRAGERAGEVAADGAVRLMFNNNRGSDAPVAAGHGSGSARRAPPAT